MKPLVSLTLALLLAGFSFVCCVLRAEEAPAVKNAWTREELLADYDFVWDTLREDFPFLPLLADQGCDPEALEAEGRETVAARCKTAGDLLHVLISLFGRMGNPAHLSALTPDSYADYVHLVENSLLFEGDPESVLVRDSQTAATYGLLGGSSAEPAEEAASRFHRPEVWYDAARDILYIHVSSFSHTLIDRDAAVLFDAVSAHPRVKDIVFDILGNGGGSDAYWIYNLVLPFGESVTYSKTVFFSLTPLNLRYGLGNGALPVSEYPGELPAFVSELGFTHFATGENDWDIDSFTGKTFSCGARRWLLIDGSLYSAADGFASFCKETGWATLVGFPTGGDGFGLRPFLVRLPNTGLLIRFTAGAAANLDGTLNTLSGTRPDFMPKPKETIRNAVIRLIEAR